MNLAFSAVNKRYYTYKATATKIIDGDTVELMIDLGFGVFIQVRVRVRFLDTPEKFSPSCEAEKDAGNAATLHAKYLLLNKDLEVVIGKFTDRSFDRYVADIFIMEEDGGSTSFAIQMILDGHEKIPEYIPGKPARYFSAQRRAEDLENAGLEDNYEAN